MTINMNFKQGTGTVEKSALQVSAFGDISGGGSGGSGVVEILFTDDEEEQTVVCSKTTTEINDIINSGKHVVGVLQTSGEEPSELHKTYLTCSFASSDVIVFQSFALSSDFMDVTEYMIINNVTEIVEKRFSAVSN